MDNLAVGQNFLFKKNWGIFLSMWNISKINVRFVMTIISFLKIIPILLKNILDYVKHQV